MNNLFRIRLNGDFMTCVFYIIDIYNMGINKYINDTNKLIIALFAYEQIYNDTPTYKLFGSDTKKKMLERLREYDVKITERTLNNNLTFLRKVGVLVTDIEGFTIFNDTLLKMFKKENIVFELDIKREEILESKEENVG